MTSASLPSHAPELCGVQSQLLGRAHPDYPRLPPSHERESFVQVACGVLLLTKADTQNAQTAAPCSLLSALANYVLVVEKGKKGADLGRRVRYILWLMPSKPSEPLAVEVRVRSSTHWVAPSGAQMERMTESFRVK